MFLMTVLTRLTDACLRMYFYDTSTQSILQLLQSDWFHYSPSNITIHLLANTWRYLAFIKIVKAFVSPGGGGGGTPIDN